MDEPLDNPYRSPDVGRPTPPQRAEDWLNQRIFGVVALSLGWFLAVSDALSVLATIFSGKIHDLYPMQVVMAAAAVWLIRMGRREIAASKRSLDSP